MKMKDFLAPKATGLGGAVRRAAMMLLLTLTTATVWAESTFGGGLGTQADPYLIKTTDHMRQLAADVNSGTEYDGIYFRLDNDLDFAGESYTPIGAYVGDVSSSGYFAFEGFFDGNHCTIRNVTINQPGSYGVGLFGMAAVWSLIKDLTLANSTKEAAVAVREPPL